MNKRKLLNLGALAAAALMLPGRAWPRSSHPART